MPTNWEMVSTPSTMSWLVHMIFFYFSQKQNGPPSSPFRHVTLPANWHLCWLFRPFWGSGCPSLFATFWGDLYRRKSLVTINGLEPPKKKKHIIRPEIPHIFAPETWNMLEYVGILMLVAFLEVLYSLFSGAKKWVSGEVFHSHH